MNAEALKIKIPIDFAPQPSAPSISETIDIVRVCSEALKSLPPQELWTGEDLVVEYGTPSECQGSLLNAMRAASNRLAAACSLLSIKFEEEPELNPS